MKTLEMENKVSIIVKLVVNATKENFEEHMYLCLEGIHYYGNNSKVTPS